MAQSVINMSNFIAADLYQTISPHDREGLILWETFVRAACRIQRAYRQRNLVSNQTYRKKCIRISTKQRSSYQQASMENIINGCATAEEKLDLWRSVIEIRRICPLYSADACLRALIECKGDLHRALAVTANSAHSWRSSCGLSLESRENMLLCADDYRGIPQIKQVAGSPLRSSLRHPRDFKLDSEADNPLTLNKKVPSFDLSGAMARIYFSK